MKTLAKLAAILFFGWLASKMYGVSSPSPNGDCDSDTMAFVMSQTFVKRELKAPASADFPWKTSDGVNVRQVAPCRFSVAAYVDAENSFGAKLRHPYSMTIEYLPASKKWQASNVTIARP